MPTRVTRNLGMERESEVTSRAHGDRFLLIAGHDFDALARARNTRSANEHAARSSFFRVEPLDDRSKLGLEAVDLPAVAVAPHRDVDEAHGFHPARVFETGRHENAARAGTHEGFVGRKLHQRIEHVVDAKKPVQHGRLATGNHERIARFEIARTPHHQNVDAEPLQELGVQGKIALKCKYTDAQGYQPRPAMSWSAGNLSISSPSMASPNPAETSMSFLGSS